jgi:heme exporter protein C
MEPNMCNDAYRKFSRFYMLLTVAFLAQAIVMLAIYTPTEATMGNIQKIFYLHLPCAIATFLACLTCFVASIGYAWQRDARWDRLAVASARVAVVFCSIVLLSGMIWGRSAWGQWWTWSPRLTFSLVLWLLYVVYLMIRASVESPQRRAIIAAVYGIIAFLDVPLVYLSTRLMPDIHPVSVQLAGSMRITLVAWFVPVLMLAAGAVVAVYHREERIAECRAACEQPAPASAASMNWMGGAS